MNNVNVSELKADLDNTYQELFNLNMQKATGQLTKPHLLRLAKKKIAKLKTKIHEVENSNG